MSGIQRRVCGLYELKKKGGRKVTAAVSSYDKMARETCGLKKWLPRDQVTLEVWVFALFLLAIDLMCIDKMLL